MFCERCGLWVTDIKQHNKWCNRGRVSCKRQRTGSVAHDEQRKKMIDYITDDINHMGLAELGKVYKHTRKVITELK